MERAVDEYWDARTKIIKSLRKMNYRLAHNVSERNYVAFGIYKNSVILELRKMDKFLRKIKR